MKTEDEAASAKKQVRSDGDSDGDDCALSPVLNLIM